ncbi:hypothetical protein CANCADRAFT_58777 [Tortispora caseinolytica NRRL Y-17796]|uniref:Uncharacterized protein n=1 Tax=Tortispora caseinolytica NRRL Y-17796 TaxID=767744 RepID=A0A1E4T999_9ASCO|nr:hypothetical protein CANCADRAFT_58777 [Tortispora caseinolytica NRRL Y-17796]
MHGDTVKLRRHPESFKYQASVERQLVAELVTLGTVKTLKIGRARSQVLRRKLRMQFTD